MVFLCFCPGERLRRVFQIVIHVATWTPQLKEHFYWRNRWRQDYVLNEQFIRWNSIKYSTGGWEFEWTSFTANCLDDQSSWSVTPSPRSVPMNNHLRKRTSQCKTALSICVKRNGVLQIRQLSLEWDYPMHLITKTIRFPNSPWKNAWTWQISPICVQYWARDWDFFPVHIYFGSIFSTGCPSLSLIFKSMKIGASLILFWL